MAGLMFQCSYIIAISLVIRVLTCDMENPDADWGLEAGVPKFQVSAKTTIL